MYNSIHWLSPASASVIEHHLTNAEGSLGLLPSFVNGNAMPHDKDALRHSALLAFNNKHFLQLKLLLYMNRF